MALWIVLLFAAGPDGEKADFPKALKERASAATVRIVNRSQHSEGSGAVIGRKDKSIYILTAAHFLKREDRLEISTFSTDSYPQPSKVYRKSEIVARGKGMRDLALIRVSVEEPLPEIVSLCAERLLPKDKEFVALSVGCGVAAAPVCIVEKVQGTARVHRREKMRPALFWQTAEGQSAGRSGGPLLDRRGRLIGVASGVNRGKGYYCHAREIHHWLKENSFDFLIAEKENH